MRLHPRRCKWLLLDMTSLMCHVSHGVQHLGMLYSIFDSVAVEMQPEETDSSSLVGSSLINTPELLLSCSMQ